MRLLIPLLSLSCAEPPPTTTPPVVRGDAPAVAAPAPTLRRLTSTQLHNSLRDLFGDELALPTSLEPDEESAGLRSVGAAVTSISPRGVEQYEAAAFFVADQVMAEGALRDAWVPCEPVATADDACAGLALSGLGERLWRRPLTESELSVLVSLSSEAASTLGDFYAGLSYGLAAMLQSPYFLYRVELGQEDEDGARRFMGYELASRLSFFLWNTAPDAALLEAAAAGELETEAGRLAQIDRMLADDRARQGVRDLFTEIYHLYELDDLSKDPNIFEHMSAQVGPSAREETLLGVEYLTFEAQADMRDLFTTRRTFLDRTLAAIYGVPAPAREGFAETMLPADGPRRGLLGQVSTLALHAHAVSTSVTRRGLFVREVLLCQEMPQPPADVDTSIPEATEDAPTMRERVERHLTDPACAGCHAMTDPIGLGLEQFDGIGRFRTAENGATIDPSGELDGAAFTDALGLGAALAAHPAATSCLVETVYTYAWGHAPDDAEDPTVDWFLEGFTLTEHRLLALLRDIAASEAFRAAGELQ
ncbi:DUF1592 domain-containing protein [Myxococcota bacterium]|nr:DUF1592 domain-containing protein [Myxococcota bacterium]